MPEANRVVHIREARVVQVPASARTPESSVGGAAVRFGQGWPHQTIDFCSGSYLCSIKYLTLWKPTLMVYRAATTLPPVIVGRRRYGSTLLSPPTNSGDRG